MIVTDGDYDAAVARMVREATGARLDHRVGCRLARRRRFDCRAIMAGYTQIFEEAAAAWGERPPDVIVVEAGVGRFAGALAGWLIARFGVGGPKLVIPEPAGAACVLASLAADALVTLDKCGPTAMAGLRCAGVSPLAWPPLRDRVDAAVGGLRG